MGTRGDARPRARRARRAGRAPLLTSEAGSDGSPRGWLRVGLMMTAVGLVVGGLSPFGQQYLPAPLAPLANSSTPWVAAVVVTLWFGRPTVLQGAVLGAAGLVLLNCGYAIVSLFRGDFYDPFDWNLVGLVVGPPIGIATALLRAERPVLRAIASAAIATIAIGEASYGLVVLAYPEQRVYWIVQTLLGVAFLVAVATRVRSWEIALQLAATLVGSGLFLLAFWGLGTGSV